MMILVFWGAITGCSSTVCCCSPILKLIVSEWHANKTIINRLRGVKRTVLVKYDSRCGQMSWHVAVLQPMIRSPHGSGESQHSGRTSRSRCKDLIQHILGGSLQLSPAPSRLPPLLPLHSDTSLWVHLRNRCPWKKSTGLTCDNDNLKKKKERKAEVLPETWKSWTMWYIIIIGMAASGNIPPEYSRG